MGTCVSTDANLKAAQRRNQEVERLLAPQSGLSQKLLLLGAGESGKSTILKQMIILHNNGFTEAEQEESISLIYANVIDGITTILKALDELKIPLEDGNLEKEAGLLLDLNEANEVLTELTEDVVTAVKKLWADAGVQRCYQRRSEYQLGDSVKYFLDAIDRISQPDFLPTDNDMLQKRAATIGVVEVTFHARNIKFRVFDVAGQRSERRKWIHCFDDVNLLIFVAAINEYDQRLLEDKNVNRLTEAVNLFNEVINNPYFAKTNAVLFLNKRDLFEEKLGRISIKEFFPDCIDDSSYDAAVSFMKLKFQTQLLDTKKVIYKHVTCATDTNQVQAVIANVVDTVVKSALKSAAVI